MALVQPRDPWMDNNGVNYTAVFKPGEPFPDLTRLSKPPRLEDVQKAVEGYIEHVCTFDVLGKRFQVWCNEEGRIKGMGANVYATEWVRMWRGFDHMLVGPIVVLAGRGALLY